MDLLGSFLHWTSIVIKKSFRKIINGVDKIKTECYLNRCKVLALDFKEC
jgi:hypothetical protein